MLMNWEVSKYHFISEIWVVHNSVAEHSGLWVYGAVMVDELFWMSRFPFERTVFSQNIVNQSPPVTEHHIPEDLNLQNFIQIGWNCFGQISGFSGLSGYCTWKCILSNYLETFHSMHFSHKLCLQYTNQCIYAIKYVYELSPFLLHVSALVVPSSGRTFLCTPKRIVTFYEMMNMT